MVFIVLSREVSTLIETVGVVIKAIEQELILKIQDWGVDEVGISCILQMDVDGSVGELPKAHNQRSLKFMIVSDSVEQYADKPIWLDLFGPYTKCHKANHGFFQIIKATYESGVTMSFVMIKGDEKNDVYKFCDIEELEKSVRILVSKN